MYHAKKNTAYQKHETAQTKEQIVEGKHKYATAISHQQ
jgi:hypothetical protein